MRLNLNTVSLLICIASSSSATISDPRELLGVSKNATREEVAAAFRKKAAMYHPDKKMNPYERIQAEAKFKEISEAFRTLKDFGEVTKETEQAYMKTIMTMIENIREDKIKFEDPRRQLRTLNLHPESLNYYLRHAPINGQSMQTVASALVFNHLDEQLEVLASRAEFIPTLNLLHHAIDNRSPECFKILFNLEMFDQHMSLLDRAMNNNALDIAHHILIVTDIQPEPRHLRKAALWQKYDLVEEILSKGVTSEVEQLILVALEREDRKIISLFEKYCTSFKLEKVLESIVHYSKEPLAFERTIHWVLDHFTDHQLELHADQLELAYKSVIRDKAMDNLKYLLQHYRLRPIVNTYSLIRYAALIGDLDTAEMIFFYAEDKCQAMLTMFEAVMSAEDQMKVIKVAQRIPALTCKERMYVYERLMRRSTSENRDQLLEQIISDPMSMDTMIRICEEHDLDLMWAAISHRQLQSFHG